MSVIGNLAVNVTANTEKFSRGMKSARHEMGLFGGVAHNLAHQITHLATGFAAGLTIHKFIHDIETATESMVELGHAANRLGATTEGLGGLQHAAAIAHISNETLVKDLTFMEKNLGKNADAFGELGLSVRELKSLHADQAFVKIAEAIERLPTAADKTAKALSIFGKGGASILQMTGSDLKAAMEEAERMGLAPSEKDVKKIEEEDKAIRRLSESYHALARNAALSVSHRATVFADNLSRMFGGGTSTSPLWQKFADEMSDKEFKDVIGEMNSSPSGTASKGILKNRFGLDRGGYDIQEFNTAMHAREKREREEFERQLHGGAFNALTSGAGSVLDSITSRVSGFGAGVAGYAQGTGMTSPDFLMRVLMSGKLRDDIMAGKKAEDDRRADALFAGDPLSDPMLDRISNSVDEMITESRGPQSTRRMARASDPIMSGAALEQGTAAAFSQSRRSQQASQQLDIQKQSHKTLQSVDKSLQNIDKNIKATTTPVTVNIA